MVIARLRAVRRNAQVDQLAKQAAEIALRLATLPALRGERERQLRHAFRGHAACPVWDKAACPVKAADPRRAATHTGKRYKSGGCVAAILHEGRMK